MKKEAAFSGLEAAIVLIAFVVVAAVFSYVMLGAGFFATQKSQEVTYSGIKQSTSNLVLDGQLYGDAKTIATLTFYLSIPEGGQSQKMSDVSILYTKAGSNVEDVTSHATYTDKSAATLTLLQPGERAKVALALSASATGSPTSGDSFTLEMKPKVGASSLISKTLGSGYNGGVII